MVVSMDHMFCEMEQLEGNCDEREYANALNLVWTSHRKNIMDVGWMPGMTVTARTSESEITNLRLWLIFRLPLGLAVIVFNCPLSFVRLQPYSPALPLFLYPPLPNRGPFNISALSTLP